MSLSELTKVSEEGVRFKSHLDGSRHMLTPGAVDRGPAAARLRHRHGVRRAGAGHGDARASRREAMERSMRWAKRSREAFDRGGEHAERAALFGIQQGALDEGLRAAVGGRADRHRLRRLCGRRAGGRRGAGGDVRLPRLRAGPAARGPAALSDGRRQARRHRRRGPARHRHVRLRAADALGPHRPGVHRRRAAQPPQCALRRGPRAARARLPVPGLRDLRARLCPSSGQVGRDPRRDADDRAQSVVLPAADAGPARGDCAKRLAAFAADFVGRYRAPAKAEA